MPALRGRFFCAVLTVERSGWRVWACFSASALSHWDLAPRPGLLVLFPSSLQHSVLPNDDPDELRCSISFDFVLTAPAQGGSPEYLAPHTRNWDSLDEPIA